MRALITPSRKHSPLTWARTFLRHESGQSLVESAASLMLGIFVCFLLFEVTMLTYTYSVLNEAAQEGVRYAIVHGTDSSLCSGPTSGCTDTTATNVKSVITAKATYSLHNIATMPITVSYPETTGCAPGSLVTVTISYPYIQYVTLGLASSFSNATITATAQGRIVY